MANKLESNYSFYRTRRSRNAWRSVCSGRIRRHFSQNEVCHKGRVSGLNDPLVHVRRNYCVREGKVSKGQGRNLTPSISLLRVLTALSATLPFYTGPARPPASLICFTKDLKVCNDETLRHSVQRLAGSHYDVHR